MQLGEERHPFTARVERAVAIEQALLVGASDDRAEAEVFELLRVRCCESWLGHVSPSGIEENTGLAGNYGIGRSLAAVPSRSKIKACIRVLQVPPPRLTARNQAAPHTIKRGPTGEVQLDPGDESFVVGATSRQVPSALLQAESHHQANQ